MNSEDICAECKAPRSACEYCTLKEKTKRRRPSRWTCKVVGPSPDEKGDYDMDTSRPQSAARLAKTFTEE